MRLNLTIPTCCLLFGLASPLAATPYRDIDLSTQVAGARWGVWRVCDLGPEGCNYMGDGDDGVQLKTYWFIGFGRLGVLRIPQSMILLLGIMQLLAIAVVLYCRRRRKREAARAAGRLR